MKTLVTAMALAALTVSPAAAKEWQSKMSHEAAAAMAYAPDRQEYRSVDRYTVVVGGRIVGRDPDPAVRMQLRQYSADMGDQ